LREAARLAGYGEVLPADGGGAINFSFRAIKRESLIGKNFG
jgi:hypothetical protein